MVRQHDLIFGGPSRVNRPLIIGHGPMSLETAASWAGPMDKRGAKGCEIPFTVALAAIDAQRLQPFGRRLVGDERSWAEAPSEPRLNICTEQIDGVADRKGHRSGLQST